MSEERERYEVVYLHGRRQVKLFMGDQFLRYVKNKTHPSALSPVRASLLATPQQRHRGDGGVIIISK